MLAGKASILFGVLCPFCFQSCVSSVLGAVFLPFSPLWEKYPTSSLQREDFVVVHGGGGVQG